MLVLPATDATAWDAFLARSPFRPFLQSWTMGTVYAAIGQPPVRLVATENDTIKGIAFGHVVKARRGTHLSVPYGPVVATPDAIAPLIDALKTEARKQGCSFVRLSPFWRLESEAEELLKETGAKPSPLHLLAEHLWYLPLRTPDTWEQSPDTPSEPRKAEDVFKEMRSTARNLIRRAEKEGVTVAASDDPVRDLPLFIALHDETRKRHGFTPYTTSFFRAQVAAFAPRKELTLYLAHYQGQVIASSIHMHLHGETSYHHGASSHAHSKIPASYLLQWTAIQDALKRGDHVYNFWGIAPQSEETKNQKPKNQSPFLGRDHIQDGLWRKGAEPDALRGSSALFQVLLYENIRTAAQMEARFLTVFFVHPHVEDDAAERKTWPLDEDVYTRPHAPHPLRFRRVRQTRPDGSPSPTHG